MKENNKILFILAGILAAIIVGAIILFSVQAAKNKASKNEDPSSLTGEELEAVTPNIDLSISTEEAEQDEVIIYVVATPGEGDEDIDHIILPDGTEVFSATTEYKVKRNGTYEFQAIGLNGVAGTESIEITNVRESSAENPYIPEGFEHIGGEPNDGYVIQDSFGNQYVWVPVPTGMMTRSTMMSTDYSDANSFATALVNSVAKNYGFYMGRFEASSYESNGVMVGASIAEKIPWTALDYRTAEEAAAGSAAAFGYTDAATALISSYAWDTTLAWIEETTPNFSSNTSYGNYSGTIYPTGSTESDQLNHICDLAGNVREWTTEEYNRIATPKKGSSSKKNTTDQKHRVVRAGSANLNKIASSRNGYAEDLTDEYWGFRMVLYENQ